MTNWEDQITEDSLDIAIIGMSARFPGADSLDDFWHNLRHGVESVSFFSDDELLQLGVDPKALRDPLFVKAGAVLRGIDQFDAGFFGYSPREAALMDPQHRLFLEHAWAALEHAGYDPAQYPGPIGVYAGTGLPGYLLFNLLAKPGNFGDDEQFQVLIGNDKDFLATRVSYHLNLKGPSLDIQTACSTSLVAIHLGCQSLHTYQCDIALVGGVNVSAPQKTGYHYQPGSVQSPDGHCRAFDARGQGTVFGNGVGVVVLKRLQDALADGDTIHAVIKGSAINNDGATKLGYTAPSVDGQAEVIERAQAMAGVDADTIRYVEAHGTGTPLGDPIEIAALTKVFAAQTKATGYCAVGSVKTNIGHLDAAAGIAGLIKTVLALKQRQIPPSLHFEQPNPQIDFANSPFYVNTELRDWPVDETPRRAGVSAFGIGGTNAHAILEEAPALPPTTPGRDRQLLVLSARTPSALEAATSELRDYCVRNPEIDLADLAFTLQVGRKALPYRRAVVASELSDAISVLSGSEPSRIFSGGPATRERPLALLFPGIGDQYPNMARELYDREPAFRATIDHCCDVLQPLLDCDLRGLLFPEPSAEQQIERGVSGPDLRQMLRRSTTTTAPTPLQQTLLAQPAVFVVEYALAQLLQSWGLKPQAFLGYSLGEYVAACLAGVFSLEDALRLVAYRARLIDDLPSGAMTAVALGPEAIQNYLEPAISLAVVNSPSACVLAGSSDALARLESLLAADGIASRRLDTSHALHSSLLAPVADELTAFVRGLELREPKIPYLSNVTGTWITPEQATDPRYWARHMCETVQFAAGVGELLADSYVMIEVGPGQNLGSFVKQHPAWTSAQQGDVLATLPARHERNDAQASVLRALGQSWLAGVSMRWSGLYENQRRRRIPLPTYPFERQRCWIDQRVDEQPPASIAQTNDTLSDADWFYLPSWKLAPLRRLAQPRQAADGQSWLIFADDTRLGGELAARLTARGEQVALVSAGNTFAVNHGEYVIDPDARDHYRRLFEALTQDRLVPQRIVFLWGLSNNQLDHDGWEAFAAWQERAYYPLLQLLQTLAAVPENRSQDLIVIGSGLADIESGDVLRPEKQTLLGLCQVAQQEQPQLAARCIDLRLDDIRDQRREQLVERLAQELLTPASESLVAYRGLKRWARHYEALPLSDDQLPLRELRPNGSYLITRGVTEAGLELAAYLANTYQARLILTCDPAFPARERWQSWLAEHEPNDRTSRKIQRLQAIEEAATGLMLVPAEGAADAEQRIGTALEELGALHGMIHLAAAEAATNTTRLPEISRSFSQLFFQAKAGTAYLLERIAERWNPDFCLIFTANNALLGGTSGASDAAAEQFLQAFAISRRAATTDWISASWDSTTAEAERQTILRRIVTQAEPGGIVVSTQPLAERLQRRSLPSSPAPAAQPAVEIAAAPPSGRMTPYVAPENEIEARIAGIWGEMLGLSQISVEDNFFDLGGNSLIGLQIIARLNKEFATEIPPVSLFERPTIRVLARLLLPESSEAGSFEQSKSRGARRRQLLRAKREA